MWYTIFLAVCGVVCIITGLARWADKPSLSLLYGFLLLLCGGLIWLLPRLNLSSRITDRISYLLIGAALLSVDLVNYYKRLKCTDRIQGRFLKTISYGARKWSGLQYGSAVFQYTVDGTSYEQASLDRRFWFILLKSPFHKKYTVGDGYSIYLDPNDPRRISLSRRPGFGLFSICGVALFFFS